MKREILDLLKRVKEETNYKLPRIVFFADGSGELLYVGGCVFDFIDEKDLINSFNNILRNK
jgi:hypothetical protein